jgi:hypothetical protein
LSSVEVVLCTAFFFLRSAETHARVSAVDTHRGASAPAARPAPPAARATRSAAPAARETEGVPADRPLAARADGAGHLLQLLDVHGADPLRASEARGAVSIPRPAASARRRRTGARHRRHALTLMQARAAGGLADRPRRRLATRRARHAAPHLLARLPAAPDLSLEPTAVGKGRRCAASKWVVPAAALCPSARSNAGRRAPRPRTDGAQGRVHCLPVYHARAG